MVGKSYFVCKIQCLITNDVHYKLLSLVMYA